MVELPEILFAFMVAAPMRQPEASAVATTFKAGTADWLLQVQALIKLVRVWIGGRPR